MDAVRIHYDLAFYRRSNLVRTPLGDTSALGQSTRRTKTCGKRRRRSMRATSPHEGRGLDSAERIQEHPPFFAPSVA